MGIGHRFFIVDDSDNIIKFPFAKYERLFQEDNGESLPQYKNSRIRYVFVSLNTKNRKPDSIWRIEYCYVTLDNKGMVDWNIFNKDMAEAMECLEGQLSGPEPSHDSNIIDAKQIFKTKQRKHRNFWKPSKELEKQIYDRIFT